ncbi:MAG: hypothetical protein H7Y89_08915 [Steroidobacteraceae bacterium]|nr:hypothetical protein [Steroidobacteraceae bacterium]
MKSNKTRKTPRAKPLRFAVIGLGHIAQAALLPAFEHGRPHADLSALVSGDRKKLDLLGKRYGVKRLHSYEESPELFASGMLVSMKSTPTKRRRPTLRQEMRRPAVPREPTMIHAESGHG